MENSKKYFIAVMMLAVVSVAISSAAFAITLSISKSVEEIGNNEKRLETSLEQFASQTSTDEQIYILKEYNGIIGIYNVYGVLTDVIDVDIKSLPEQDQTMLGTGIYAMSRRELASLIEDYTG